MTGTSAIAQAEAIGRACVTSEVRRRVCSGEAADNGEAYLDITRECALDSDAEIWGAEVLRSLRWRVGADVPATLVTAALVAYRDWAHSCLEAWD